MPTELPTIAPGTLHIRWLIRRDMPEILTIERLSFANPWPEEDFIACLRQRNCVGMVGELDGQVVAFMVYELHKDRLHLINFTVHPCFRGRGLGRQMIERMKSKTSPNKRSRLMLEVRETNVGAQLFFRRLGFRAVVVLHDFYDDTDEAAYLFEWFYSPEDVREPTWPAVPRPAAK